MKVAFVLAFAVLSVSATQWRDIKSPIDSPRYKDIVDKMMGGIKLIDNDISGRITNGQEAKLGDFPYQVYMYLTTGSGTQWLCGGSVTHFSLQSNCLIELWNIQDHSCKMDFNRIALCWWNCEGWSISRRSQSLSRWQSWILHQGNYCDKKSKHYQTSTLRYFE